MRISTLALAAVLASASAGVAQAATNLVLNGDFSATSGVTVPTQFGSEYPAAGNFIENWAGSGYALWFPDAATGKTVSAIGQWTSTGKEMLWDVTAPPSTTAFVALDGEQNPGVQASIEQQLSGLTAGKTYNVAFDWAAGQLQSRDGATDELLQVSFGGATQSTGVVTNVSHGFNGWFSESFSFVADSDNVLLKFLSVGNPAGLPPIALLTNVSVTESVPEAATWVMLIAGFGLVGVASRRRRTIVSA